MLQIHLLGTPRIQLEDTPLTIARRKGLALLAYMAVTAQAHSRDSLAALLWPEYDQSAARANLRRDLSRLKQAVGEPFLAIDRSRAGLTAGTWWLDVATFERHLSTVRQHHQNGQPLCADCASLLHDAVELYQGDFMAGFAVPDSAAFDEWHFFQSEGLRQGLAEALQQLIDWHAAQQAFEQGIEYGRQWLALDPLHEPAQRQLMQLYAWSGQQAAALRQYQEGVRLLQEELGVEPEAQTVALYQAIRRREIVPPKADDERDVAIPAGHRPARGARSLTTHTAHASEQEIRFTVTSDGVRIAYSTVGQGPVLVKTGNWLSHLEYDWNSPVWRHWLMALSEHYTLVRYDQRGCGLSDWDASELSLDGYVRDLEAVVDALGLQRFPLLGLSAGGAIAIAYAVRHPEKVSRLITYGSYAAGRHHRAHTPEEGEKAELLVQLMKVGWGKDNPAFHQFFTTLFMPQATVEQMRWFNELQRVSTSPETALRLQQAFFNINVRHLLPHVVAPTLVLHGRNDAVVPYAEGRELAATIPNARFVSLDSENHILLEDEPAWPRLVDEVCQFLDAERDSTRDEAY